MPISKIPDKDRNARARNRSNTFFSLDFFSLDFSSTVLLAEVQLLILGEYLLNPLNVDMQC